MDFLQDLGSSITGSIHKAILLTKKINRAEGADNRTDSKRNFMLRERLLNAAGSTFRYSAVKSAAMAYGYHAMQVKYNPNSIQLSTQAGSFMQSGTGGGGVNQITQITVPAQTVMEVELIFDDVNIPDAFQFEKFNVNTGGIVSSAAGAVKQSMKSFDGYSVQTQIDGLVAMVTQPESRQVIFFWGDMIFSGEVVNVAAKYTMFNPSGHPIRGTVSLSIFQTEGGESGGEEKYWNQAFTKMFGDYNQDTDVSDAKFLDKLGNLLNL